MNVKRSPQSVRSPYGQRGSLSTLLGFGRLTSSVEFSLHGNVVLIED